MTRSLSFAALAGLLSLAAACGGSSDDAETAPAQESAAPAAAEPQAETAPETAMAKPEPGSGADVFAKQCSWCHAPGVDHPGTMQLGATRGQAFAVLQEREDLNADYVKYIVRHGLNAMPPFKPTTITDVELDKLANYLAKAD